MKSVLKRCLSLFLCFVCTLTSIINVSASSVNNNDEVESFIPDCYEKMTEGYSFEFSATVISETNMFTGTISARNHTTQCINQWAIKFKTNFEIVTSDDCQFIKTSNDEYIACINTPLLSNCPIDLDFSGIVGYESPLINEVELFTEPLSSFDEVLSNDDEKYPIYIDISDELAISDGIVLQFSLKENNTEFAIKITDETTGNIVVNQMLNNNSSTISSEFKLNNQYYFEYVSNNSSIIGRFTIYQDRNTYFLSQYYDCISNTVSRSTSVSETENNNSVANADSADILFSSFGNENNIITGVVSSSTDIDYFEFTAPGNGYVNLTLIISGAYNYDLYAQTYIQGNLSTVGISTNAKGSSESVRFSVNNGQTYYIKIVNASGSSDLGYQYKLHGTYNFSKAWFSQIKSCDNGIQYWNTDYLDKLCFKQGNTTYSTPFMIDGTYPKGDCMDEGCALACVAMVLNNLNATRLCWDFRLGLYTSHKADPFTVMMANINTTAAPTYSSSEKKYYYTIGATLSDEPESINNWNNLANRFGHTSVETAPGSSFTHSEIAALLNNNPEGLIAYVGNHYIVICGDRGASYEDDRFLVCDPGTPYANKGCYKPLSTRNKYTISSIASIRYIV